MTYAILLRGDGDKKYKIMLFDSANNNIKTVNFGERGYEDYTTHRDPDRKERYIKRHQKNEDWTNPLTAGFWSRWLLWNKPSLKESIDDIERNFNINII